MECEYDLIPNSARSTESIVQENKESIIEEESEQFLEVNPGSNNAPDSKCLLSTRGDDRFSQDLEGLDVIGQSNVAHHSSTTLEPTKKVLRSLSVKSFEDNELLVDLADQIGEPSCIGLSNYGDLTPRGCKARQKLTKELSVTDENDEKDFIVDFFGKSNDEAESRLAARRQARAEAREIRMRELEKQQREAEENADKHYEMTGASPDPPPLRPISSISTSRLQVQTRLGGSALHGSSRRSSEDSTEESLSLREMKYELRDLEEKFRRAMVANAQLDNEKSALTYQISLLKDELEEMQETNSRIQKESREHKREGEQLRLLATKLKDESEYLRRQVEERDRLIEEHSLVLVGDSETEDSSDEEEETTRRKSHLNSTRKTAGNSPRKALVSQEVAQLLEKAGEGSLDVRIRRLTEEKRDLSDQVRRLRLELEEERTSHLKQKRLAAAALATAAPTIPNGVDSDPIEMQREIAKQTNEYKFKLQKAEQEVATLQANVSRLESQVQRYKTAAEAAEQVEDDLKAEKRKLQRELREAQTRLEELETSQSHLQKRLDKLKSAKSALLKDI
ncbi:leucine-rich repeat flightless-interacting protein 2-like isoform X1 [Artemia franciscana]|uniref:leucine-rich repeat flightless-interacting protein 2-like isoform X1 n=1 Tax=Artemia franciscana TaxID=6661 RepID=UPI0032D9D86A